MGVRQQTSPLTKMMSPSTLHSVPFARQGMYWPQHYTHVNSFCQRHLPTSVEANHQPFRRFWQQSLRLLIVFFLSFFFFFCFSFLVWCPLMLDSDTKFVIAVNMVYSPGIHVILLASKRSTISSRTSQSAPGIIYMIASR
jgi:hypothetical protein